MGERPGAIIINIRRHAEFSPVFQCAGQPVQRVSGHKTPLAMALFGPRVGEQQKGAPQLGGRQHIQKSAGVSHEQTDIRQGPGLQPGEQAGHAVEIGLTTDKTDVRVPRRLLKQVLPRAKADFQPNVLLPVIQAGRIKRRFEIKREPRQEGFDQRRLMRAQGVAPPPAVKTLHRARAVFNASLLWRQDTALFKASTRSRFSQEKPPSASGVRPK